MELPENIKTFLRDLNDVQHERLMTTELVPFYRRRQDRDAGCLVGVAFGCVEQKRDWLSGEELFASSPEQTVWRNPKYAGPRLPVEAYQHSPHLLSQLLYEAGGPEYIHMTFNRLASLDREGTEQAIRDYIVQLRLERGGTVAEPQMVEAVAC